MSCALRLHHHRRRLGRLRHRQPARGEDYRLRILILEAGPPDNSFMLKMPAGFASLGEKSPYNWRYETTPQKHCNDRRMYWPRGKTLGGSSSINAMLYVRGHAWDYDHWRQLGNEGWSYDDVLPYFKKAENNERGADDFHGTGGPLNVADQTDPAQASTRRSSKAAEQAGHKRDHRLQRRRAGRRRLLPGDAEEQGALEHRQRLPAAGGRARQEQRRGRSPARWSNASSSTATAPWACATVKDGRDEVARCSREIILCGGAVNSPQLLMLSGIGPADHLKSLGIRPLHDLPGVGGNLQDHLDAALLQFCKTRDTYDTANKLVVALPVRGEQEGPRHLADRRVGRLPAHAAGPRRARHPAPLPAGAGGRSRPHQAEEERLQPARLHAQAREHRHDPAAAARTPRTIR